MEEKICSCGCSCGHEGETHHKKQEEHTACGCTSHREEHDACGCGCGCSHEHGRGGAIRREEVVPLACALVLLLAGLLLPMFPVVKNVCLLGAYLISGREVLVQAWRNILKGRIFDEAFLMAVASVGACLIGEVGEGAAVMIFYNIGELFQSYAVGRSRGSISALMDIRPDVANVLRDGQVVEVAAERVEVGECILVRMGERIPLDGMIEEGVSRIDTSALTGESMPWDVAAGDSVLAGCINLDGVLQVSVTKPFAETTASKILELAEHASANKATAEQFITKFARYYTPAVIGVAAIIAVFPPLLGLGMWSDFIHRALTFLVISCPCALVISVPMGFFAGIGCASRNGILVKGGNYLEALCDVKTVVFDKTGTLTSGRFEVLEVCAAEISAEALLELAALAENDSHHPIANSLRQAYGKEIDRTRIGAVKEVPGKGIEAVIDRGEVFIGNRNMMESKGISVPTEEDSGTFVYLGKPQTYLGRIRIGDRPKQEAKQTLSDLRRLGVSAVVMLTGDRRSAAEEIGREVGIDKICADLLPGDKVAEVERLLKEKECKGKMLFVGDGMNDAPVLARADIGVAMGGLGTDAAMEAADVVIMDDRIDRLPVAIQIARHTKAIVIQNIVFTLGVKLFILTLGALGNASMWAAVFADVGVSLIAVLNSLRALKDGK